jgi:hypothetical protein
MIKFIITFLILTTNAQAGAFVGLASNYLHINEEYKYKNTVSKPAFNIGYNYIYKNFVLTATTNRLLNQSTEKTVTKDGLSFENKTRITADTLMLGYSIKRFTPAVFFTNAGVSKKLYRDNELLGKTEQNAILAGFSITYSYDRDLNFSTAIIAPNQELGLEYGFNFGINYNL